MKLREARVGIALCGSFCTYQSVWEPLEQLKTEVKSLIPIQNADSGSWNTRFGKAADWRDGLEQLCGTAVLDTIPSVEPIGPRRELDLLIVAPCTGNTLGKLAAGIADTPVTMAVKSHLRNQRPVLIAPSTNDGLAVSLRNLGELLMRKHIYVLPMVQDDPVGKPNSLVADFSRLTEGAGAALEERQLRPLFFV